MPICDTVRIFDNCFGIDNEAGCSHSLCGARYVRKFVRPIDPSAREIVHTLGGAPNLDQIYAKFNLVNPLITGWGVLAFGGVAELDEARNRSGVGSARHTGRNSAWTTADGRNRHTPSQRTWDRFGFVPPVPTQPPSCGAVGRVRNP